MPSLSRTSLLVAVALLSAAYVGLGRLGLAVGSFEGNVAPVWPASGLAVAALVVLGLRVWPAVTIGAFVVNASTGVPVLASIGMATGNTLEAVLGAYLFQRAVLGTGRIARVRDVLMLAGLVAGSATTVSATLGVTSLWLAGVTPTDHYLSSWAVWWIGDALGVMVVTPLLLELATVDWRQPGRRVSAEGLLLVGVLAVVGVLVFGGLLEQPYLVFPVLIWAALRLKVLGATFATLVITVFTVLGTSYGHGAFAGGSVIGQLWLLDLFLLAVALTGLVIAVAADERDRYADQLRRLAGRLDEQVRARSSQLELEQAKSAVLEDRERIARDLHDRVLQRIFATGLEVSEQGRLAAQHLEDSGELPEQLRPERFHDIAHELDATIRELRSAITGLGNVDDLANTARALEQTVARSERFLGFRPTLVVRGDLEQLPERLAEQVILVVREGLANVAKHAAAKRAVVSVVWESDEITVSISDDGVGLPTVLSRSSGVTNIRHRAQDLGGTAEWHPAHPRGTRLAWRVPHPAGAAGAGRRSSP
ncbi:MAG TPA: MASE1 domain-containing protein [Nocardioidaceae bacterium]|nr:MASE1 domain-containing protein [Nocardioidaceae bacterium]